MAWVLMLDVAGALIACASLALITIPNPVKNNPDAKTGMLHEMEEGFRAISSKAGIVWLFVFSILATFFIMPISMLFPLMALNPVCLGEGKKATLNIRLGSLELFRFAPDGSDPVKIKNGMLNAEGKNSLTIEMNESYHT